MCFLSNNDYRALKIPLGYCGNSTQQMRIPEMEIFSGYRVGNAITRNQNFFFVTDVVDMKKIGRIELKTQVN